MNNKVNFTKEHQEKLDQFVLKMWKENIVVFNTMNVPINICDLKELTPNSLNNLKLIYDKKIQALESRDEWIDPENDKIDLYRFIREGLNLLVGYKRKNIEIAENEAKKKQLDKTIAELEESQKTPEDKLKELKAQIEQFLVNFRDMDIFDVYTPLQALYRSNRYEPVRLNTL